MVVPYLNIEKPLKGDLSRAKFRDLKRKNLMPFKLQIK